MKKKSPMKADMFHEDRRRDKQIDRHDEAK